jgi:hypothetical protein
MNHYPTSKILFDALIGALVDLPHAINTESSPRTIVIGVAEISPLKR